MSIRVSSWIACALALGCGAPCPTPGQAITSSEARQPGPATATAPRGVRLQRIDIASRPGWETDALADAVTALVRSCRRLARLPDDRPIGASDVGGVAADWRRPCEVARRIPPGDDAAARSLFESEFTAFAVLSDGDPNGRFTGYYQPTLRASRRRTPEYSVPIYERPGDLVSVSPERFGIDSGAQRIYGRVDGNRLVPYWTREQIASGALSGRGLEILWGDDPIDVFFAQIQGSARVILAGGGEAGIGFAGKNGRRYTAIGRHLVDAGELPHGQSSMQAIRQWLLDHPDRMREVLDVNQSFVFFEIRDRPDPVGSQGVALTPGRSLAVDRAHIPLSAPLWVETIAPLPGEGQQPWARLVIAQDTGGGIRGPVRGDIYWGADADAADIAGRMNSTGRYFLLLPNAIAERFDR